ncbi:YpmS family protein [Robertmurraya andreesenii]|uniref:Uncharacterized protein YpmS n=1 Tax=Anoxybacillus andreesenii TaxID=1325932 RepID=A0ABT9V2C3_9BACL|nr:YpmS family protein [Robertmurraya andreesenii]MDQ0155103.1 uncharacterized protein YpmS [Robertmurraya andreesenii]
MNKKWKLLFFLLLGINILVIFLMVILINLPIEDEAVPKSNEKAGRDVQFKIQTNKQDLNQIINHYIEEEGFKSPIDYKVMLQDEVELLGTMKVFTQDIEMKLTFEPEALPNGDLILRQKSISVGQLPLPVSFVLKFIRDQYDFPKWVTIQPNDELIYVSLQEMKLKSDIKVRVNKFDLKNDDIQFTLLVPTAQQ